MLTHWPSLQVKFPSWHPLQFCDIRLTSFAIPVALESATCNVQTFLSFSYMLWPSVSVSVFFCLSNDQLQSYIFIALSRDTSLAHIFSAYGPMAIWPNMALWPFMAIWPSDHKRQIWASGVSLERTIKM